MARDKEQVGPVVGDDEALISALENASPDRLKAILAKAGIVPTAQGMDASALKAIVESFQAISTTSVRETLRQERKENPSYPARSVFLPRGEFGDDGTVQEPKVRLRRHTFFCGVRLSGELETEEEITLLNAFTEDRTARDGRWTATITEKGTPRERLLIVIPSLTSDDRMENALPLVMILRELLQGPEAVTTESLEKRLAALERENASLKQKAVA